MTRTITDPEIRLDSPYGHWSVSVAIPEEERKLAYVDKFATEHRGKPFMAVRASFWAPYGGADIHAAISGPNIKQDGTPGAYSLGGRLTPAELAEGYPETWAMIVTACGDAITRIREDAHLAARQIEQALGAATP